MSQSKVLIIGGTGYLGSACVKDFFQAESAQSQSEVHITYCNQESRAHELERDFHVRSHHLDIFSRESCENFSKEIMNELTELDAIVFCVGPKGAHIFAATEEKFNFVPWEVLKESELTDEIGEFISGFLLIVQNLVGLLKNGSAKNIIVLTSLEGYKTKRSSVLLAATQGAIRTLCKSLSFDFGKYQIKINAVAVGISDGGTGLLASSSLKADFIKHSATGRVIKGSEVAKLVRFFALENSYMTGETISLDGGL